jgi:hypothetical protein
MRAKDKRITQMEHMTPVHSQHKPLIERTERERAEASLITYHLSEEERLAYIAKYPPRRTVRPNILRPRPRRGQEA